MAFTKCLVESEVAFIGLHQSSWPSSLSWLSRSQASQRNRHCWNCRKCHWLQGFHGLHGLHIFHWPSLPSSWPSLPSLPSSPSWPSFSASRSSGQICHCVKNTWKKHEKNGSVGLSQEWNEMDASQVQWPRSAQHKEIWRTVHLTHSISISFSICHCLFNSFHGVELQRILLHHGKCICHTYLVEWVSKSSLLEGTHDVLHEINSRKQNKTKQ